MDRIAQIDARMERDSINRQNRRIREEAAAYDKMGRQMDAADALIGELCMEGKTVLYINIKNLRGVPTGKIRTGSRHDLVDYLIRNRYV